MFKNYFKTAWRNLWKNRLYSIINISGLAIGLAVGIMILLWVQDEISYDKFHENAETIYKLNSHIGSGSSAQVWDGAPAPLAIFGKQSIPEVTNAVRIMGREPLLFANGSKKILEESSAYVDSSFFSMFSFSLVKGNQSHPFPDNKSIILTQATAKKYFGTEDAIGKTLLNSNDNYVVSGIIKDFPKNSSIQYDMLFPESLYAKNFGGNLQWKTVDEDLGNFAFYTYLQLRKNASPDVVGKKLSKMYVEKKGEHAQTNFLHCNLYPVCIS